MNPVPPDLTADQLAEKVRREVVEADGHPLSREGSQALDALLACLAEAESAKRGLVTAFQKSAARLAEAEQMAERFGASAEARLVEKRAAEAERDRLKDALEQIDRVRVLPVGGVKAAFDIAQRIARAALLDGGET